MSKRSHAFSLCRSRLLSALRTALACTFVGLATAYSPSTLSRHLKFPALSYVVATLIVGNNATLGSTLAGATEALCGMALGLLPAAMALYMVRPEGISAVTSAAAVAVSAFVVSVSEWAGLTAKRVALAQIVIVYVTACKEESGDGRVAAMHPVPVAVSTAIGAAAAVLALVVPYPRLACYEVRERSRCYTELTVERFRLFVSAFCDDNSNCMDAFIFRAKSLTVTCNKLLQNIKLMQGSMKWEIPPLKFLQPYLNAPGDRLQAMETPLKGMGMALSSTTSPPFKILNELPHFKDKMISLRDEMLSSNLDEETNFMADQNYMIDKTIQSFNLSSTNLQHLPSLFFIFCMQLLCNGETLTSPSTNPQQESKVTPATEEQSANSCKQEAPPTDKRSRIRSSLFMNLISNKSILIALKCSLSLSLAVLFGVLFKRDNAYWSGLTVAFAFTPSRESTFKLASLRAHGTALGSVFGVLASFISQNLMEVRLVALIPFIVFTSFLQSSRMYGQAGASSAAISAMIILGRRIDGSPMLFSIERLTECYIGLCCSILIEVLLQPTRAATLARNKASECLEMLDGCIFSVTNTAEFKEKEKKLRRSVNKLKKYVAEAELEPNFWFLPFPAASYKRLHGSLSKMVDLLLFMLHGVDALIKDSKEEETMKSDLDQFKELVGAQVKCLKDVVQVKSVTTLEKELECKSSRNHDDIESGKLGKESLYDEEKLEDFVSSFLQHSSEVVDNRLDQEVGVEIRNKQVLCFAAVGFCMGGLIREVREMEKGVVEIVQSENTSSHDNLLEISCKVKEASS